MQTPSLKSSPADLAAETATTPAFFLGPWLAAAAWGPGADAPVVSFLLGTPNQFALESAE